MKTSAICFVKVIPPTNSSHVYEDLMWMHQNGGDGVFVREGLECFRNAGTL